MFWVFSVTFSVLNIPPAGNYTVYFEVIDPCYNLVTGSKVFVVKYKVRKLHLPYLSRILLP